MATPSTAQLLAANAAHMADTGRDIDSAASVIPPLAKRAAGRHGLADDVASVARCILPAVIAAGYTDTMAAGIAVKRAAASVLSDAGIAVESATETMADRGQDDDEPASASLPRAATPNGARIAETSPTDTLREALALVRPYLTDRQAAILREVAWCDAWQASRLPVARIGRNLGLGNVTGRAGMALGQEIRDTLVMVRDTVALVRRHDTYRARSQWTGNTATLADSLRECACGNGARTLTSWDVNYTGQTFLLGLTRAERDQTEAARTYGKGGESYTVAPHRRVSNWSRREVQSAVILASTDATTTTARRPCGVAAGMVHGSGRIAGNGTPDPRPTPPRKARGRVGSTGPTVPA